MPPFNVDLQLTGLCAFVPNNALSSATKLMAVLPNAEFPAGSSVLFSQIDDKPLARHRGFIRISLESVSAPTGSPEDSALYYIAPGTRITVETDPPAVAATGLKITTGTSLDSFEWVADLTQLIPIPNDIDPLAVSSNPPLNVLAQVLIEGGVVTNTKLPPTIWDFRPSPPAQVYTGKLAHEASVSYAGVNRAFLVIQHGLGPSQKLELLPDSTGKAVARISNACDDNPLEWRRNDIARADTDFRWFYELLPPASRVSLKQQLKHTDMPIPTVVSEGGGPDCSPGLFAALAF